jgi:hypothetical protein
MSWRAGSGKNSRLRARPHAIQEQLHRRLDPLVDLLGIGRDPQHGHAGLAADDEAQEEIGGDGRVLDLRADARVRWFPVVPDRANVTSMEVARGRLHADQKFDVFASGIAYSDRPRNFP